jgi:hypothetical protein
MSDNLNYRLFPQETSYKSVTLTESERKNIDLDGFGSAGGCLIWVGFFSYCNIWQ